VGRRGKTEKEKRGRREGKQARIGEMEEMGLSGEEGSVTWIIKAYWQHGTD
jgi:hypothetical protein